VVIDEAAPRTLTASVTAAGCNVTVTARVELTATVTEARASAKPGEVTTSSYPPGCRSSRRNAPSASAVISRPLVVPVSRIRIEAAGTRAPLVSWTMPVRAPRGFWASTGFELQRHRIVSADKHAYVGRVGHLNMNGDENK